MNPITFILIDGSTTTKDICVSVEGIDIAQFEKNPVMFYQHNDWNMPVGKWENIRKENGQLLADAVFDYEDTDKEVQRMIKKVEKGFIKMASCGLVDLECSEDPTLCQDGDCCVVVTSCRLREASIVAVGGNHNAMALRFYDNDGTEIKFGNEKPNIKLSDFIVKPKIEIMYKKYLSLLNLADTATEADFYAKVDLLLADKQNHDAKVLKLTDDLKKTTEELNALLLADKQAKRTAFENELELCFKDGRLSEKPEGEKLTPVRDNMMNLFDKDPEGTRLMLGSIATPTKLEGMNLGDKGTERQELEKMSFIDIDKAGKQLLLKDSYPDLYKTKYKEQYGVEPKA